MILLLTNLEEPYMFSMTVVRDKDTTKNKEIFLVVVSIFVQGGGSR
jgi:hypothetical protein